MAQSGARGVQSVERALEILELITDVGGEVTLSELSTHTDLPLPTIHRLLRTLVARGYARQLPNRRYSLGAKLIRLGEVAGRQLGGAATPYLKEIVDSLDETANMAILESDMVVYIAQVPSKHSMRMFTEVGHRAHLHDTGVGKAILGELDDESVRRIVERTGMPTPTPKSLGSVEALLAELATVRERGYAIDEEEQELGVRCFSMIVPDAPTPMAISVSGPVSRVDDRFAERAVPTLRDAAAKISKTLTQQG